MNKSIVINFGTSNLAKSVLNKLNLTIKNSCLKKNVKFKVKDNKIVNYVFLSDCQISVDSYYFSYQIDSRKYPTEELVLKTLIPIMDQIEVFDNLNIVDVYSDYSLLNKIDYEQK